MMRYIGPIIGRLRIGRFRDWYRFTWAKFKTPGTVIAAELPHIDPPFMLRIAPGGTLELGRNVHFFPGFHCYVGEGGEMKVGDNVLFNSNVYVGAISRLTIGNGVLFGPCASVTDGNHEFSSSDLPIWQQGFERRDVTIGDNVWLGAKATLINSVGSDCVIGANAVVTDVIPDNSVAVGVPARVIRKTREGESKSFSGDPVGG